MGVLLSLLAPLWTLHDPDSPAPTRFGASVSHPKLARDGSMTRSTHSRLSFNGNQAAEIIKHQQNLISVYKHNESLAVNQGDLVLSGEVISFAGSTGTLSTGPHLHLELWSDGYPINPTELIEFE